MFHVKHWSDMVLIRVPRGRDRADADGSRPPGTQTHRRPFDTPLARLLRVRGFSSSRAGPEGRIEGRGNQLKVEEGARPLQSGRARGHRCRRLCRDPPVRCGGELSSIPGGRPGPYVDLPPDLRIPVLPTDPSKLRQDTGQVGLHRGAGFYGGRWMTTSLAHCRSGGTLAARRRVHHRGRANFGSL